MDLHDLLAQARRNAKEKSASKVNGYSTQIQPPKKLPKNPVDQKAVCALLKRQRDEQKRKDLEASKKKAELLKLRDATKNTRKANSMAKRTKDNLKVYKGEDVLGMHSEPKKRRRNGSANDLTPEEDRRHKAFMKSVSKMKIPGINDEYNEIYEPLPEQDERKRRKMEKLKAKSRSASNLDFADLMKVAEEQKHVESSSSSEESDSGNDSDGNVDRFGKPLSAEEKYYREKRKRRELKERLKMMEKKQSSQDDGKKSSKSLTSFKIGKLNSAMSEDAKKAKIQAIMASFTKSSHDKQSGKANSSANSIVKVTQKSSVNDHRESASKKRKREHEKPQKSQPYTPAKKPKAVPPASSADPISSYLKKQELMLSSRAKKPKAVLQKSPNIEVQKPKPETMNGKKFKEPSAVNGATKRPTNPYKHTVVKSKGADPSKLFIDPWAKEKSKKVNEEPPPRKGKCTLSVTSEEVRTNYPGVAKESPYIQSYKKTGKVIQNFTPEMIAKYKAVMIRKLREQGRPIPPSLLGGQKQPVPKRRYGVIDDYSDDEEYDSELEDFIADDEEVEEDVDVSSHIKQIFGYDKSKYGRESEWELSRMDASYKDIEKEEKRRLELCISVNILLLQLRCWVKKATSRFMPLPEPASCVVLAQRDHIQSNCPMCPCTTWWSALRCKPGSGGVQSWTVFGWPCGQYMQLSDHCWYANNGADEMTLQVIFEISKNDRVIFE